MADVGQQPTDAAAQEAEDEALLAAMEASNAAVDASLRPSVEEERAMMEATRERAVEHGQPKASGEVGYVGSMRRKFEVFLEKHGASYGYVATEGPTPEIAKRFMEYCFSGAGRAYFFSAVGRRNLYDGYFSTHLPYTLAQRVFPAMKLPGWDGLDKADRQVRRASRGVARRAADASRGLGSRVRGRRRRCRSRRR